MGTGSFGGGSGGFGGGGSGGGGGGGNGSSAAGSSGIGGTTSGRRGASGPTRRKDSIFARIQGLLKFTAKLDDKTQDTGRLRKNVTAALQARGRKKYMMQLVAEPFIDAIFREVMEIGELTGERFACATVARRYGLRKEHASLRSLVQALIDKHSNPAVDERFVEIARRAVTDLFLRAVDNDFDLYVEARCEEVDAAFQVTVFKHVCGLFLSSMIREVIRGDLLHLSAEALANLDDVTAEIASDWVRFFETTYRSDTVRHRDMIVTLAEHYDVFSKETI